MPTVRARRGRGHAPRGSSPTSTPCANTGSRSSPAPRPVDDEVERFAEKIGHVREIAFERVHNVRHDPAGYNVAHTPVRAQAAHRHAQLQLAAVIQLLHFLVNGPPAARAPSSTAGPRWPSCAATTPHALRHADPRPGAASSCSASDEDTGREAPMIQLDTDGRVAALPVLQPARPAAAARRSTTSSAFYAAYRRLGSDDRRPATTSAAFKSATATCSPCTRTASCTAGWPSTPPAAAATCRTSTWSSTTSWPGAACCAASTSRCPPQPTGGSA